MEYHRTKLTGQRLKIYFILYKQRLRFRHLSLICIYSPLTFRNEMFSH